MSTKSKYQDTTAVLQVIGSVLACPELLEEEGIEFVAVEPPRELKKDKKVTLDAFG